MRVLITVKDSVGCIREIKFSPNDLKFAVGTSSRAVDIYTAHDFKRRANLKWHQAAVHHLDWSIDSKLVQTTSEAKELIFVDTTDLTIVQNVEKRAEVRNEEWQTQTCDIGWSVQGIWKEDKKDPKQVRSIDRSNNKFFREYQALAVGENDGSVRLYKYPCVQPSAKSVSSKGHSSFISNLKWTADDQYIISTGCEDQTIIIWQVKTSF